MVNAARHALLTYGLALALLLACGGPAVAQEGDAAQVTLSGQMRFRGEWDGRTVGTGDDAAVLSRIRLGVRADVRPWLTAFAQLQDHRAWGTEADPVEGSADAFDLHQGYVDLTQGEYTVRIGRQEVGLGDERLVGPLAWANTGRSFDGVLARRELPGGHVRAFWMNVHERDALTLIGVDPQANEGEDEDGWLIGAFVTTAVGGATLEGIFLHDRNAATGESSTAHGRVHGSAGRVLFDGSGAYQFGPDLRAFLFSAKLGLAFAADGSIAAQLDYISGDDDPLDATDHAFRTLYPTAHAYHGYMDYFLAFPGNTVSAGLMDAIARVAVPMPDPWRLRGDLHRFSLAKARDGSRALGWEADAVVARDLTRGASVELGASAFFPTDLMRSVAPAFSSGADPTYWGYLMLIVGW